MGRNKGWRPQDIEGQFKCLDCGTLVVVNFSFDAIELQRDMESHDAACVPGNDAPPSGPIGLALGMSIQLRDLFVMAQLSEYMMITEKDAVLMYANADLLVKARG